jgi:hypothetical protein
MNIRRSITLALTVLLALAAMPRVLSAQKLADADVKKLGMSGSSADHKKLAAHYRAHAAEHESDAKLHEEIITATRKQEATFGHAWELARGAAHYAEHSKEAAEALRELAALHEGMAEVAAEKAPVSKR